MTGLKAIEAKELKVGHIICFEDEMKDLLVENVEIAGDKVIIDAVYVSKQDKQEKRMYSLYEEVIIVRGQGGK